MIWFDLKLSVSSFFFISRGEHFGKVMKEKKIIVISFPMNEQNRKTTNEVGERDR